MPRLHDHMAQQNHWSERGRAKSVGGSDALGRPRRSVLALGRHRHHMKHRIKIAIGCLSIFLLGVGLGYLLNCPRGSASPGVMPPSPDGRGEVGDGLQHVIRRADRPVNNELPARRRDAQIGDLPERGVNANKQGQRDEQIVEFGFHGISFWHLGRDEEHSRFPTEVLLL